LPSKISEHAKYGFGLRPFIDPQKCRTTTGPGFYDPKYFDGNQSISLKGRPKDVPDKN
jgi:hypothetical protein